MSVYELTPRELYETYVEGIDPAALLEMDRTEIAARLMRDAKMSDEDAYYTTDQIMVYAQERVDIEAGLSTHEEADEMTG
jgi:hypothetical protein